MIPIPSNCEVAVTPGVVVINLIVAVLGPVVVGLKITSKVIGIPSALIVLPANCVKSISNAVASDPGSQLADCIVTVAVPEFSSVMDPV